MRHDSSIYAYTSSRYQHGNRIPNEVIDRANSLDIRELANRYVELRKVSAHERAGPCPKCGGTDRFYVGPNYFGCRKCPKSKSYGAINFAMWVENLGFREAVAALGNYPFLPKPTRRQALVKKRVPSQNWRNPRWQQQVVARMQRSHNMLTSACEAKVGREYLLDRGIEHHSWRAFQVGYDADVSVPGTSGRVKAPAIVLPWIVQRSVRGIRYRFLGTPQGHKQTAYYGSSFSGILYGGQVLDGNTPTQSTLLLVEGELNAISCWQVTRNTGLDVLSLGSESAPVTAPMVAAASAYRHVVTWMDRTEVVRSKITQLPGAYGIRSPDNRDANDMLQAGLLAEFLACVRLRVDQAD